jgi:hypothetical protein
MRCQWIVNARLLYVQKTLFALCFDEWKWENRPRGKTRAAESGGRGSIAGGDATFGFVFFCSTVLLPHLNSIYTLVMALHNTAVRIKK